MQWTHDSESSTYSVTDLTPLEMATAVAALIAGFTIINTSDPYGAEAARRNLINHLRELGEPESHRLLDIFIAADAHRIRAQG